MLGYPHPTMTNRVQFRNQVFTVNNYTEEDLTALQKFAQDKCKYLVYGKEIAPTTGTPHLQCAAVFNSQLASKTLDKMCPTHPANRAKIIALTGSHNAFDYCKKGIQSKEEWTKDGKDGLHHGDEADYWEHGEQPDPGKRTDLQITRDRILELDTFHEIVNDPDPHLQGALCRHPHYVKMIHNHRPRKPKPLPDLRPWQAALLDRVQQPPDDRTIMWFYDPVGQAGKSTIAKILCSNYGGIMLGGKHTDMFHAYDGEKIVVVNLPRSSMNVDSQDNAKFFCPYGAIEAIKDGHFFSGKYESRHYIRDYNVHIIVFSNHLPENDKWTSDRLSIIHLSEPPTYPDYQFGNDPYDVKYS